MQDLHSRPIYWSENPPWENGSVQSRQAASSVCNRQLVKTSNPDLLKQPESPRVVPSSPSAVPHVKLQNIDKNKYRFCRSDSSREARPLVQNDNKHFSPKIQLITDSTGERDVIIHQVGKRGEAARRVVMKTACWKSAPHKLWAQGSISSCSLNNQIKKRLCTPLFITQVSRCKDSKLAFPTEVWFIRVLSNTAFSRLPW